MTQGSQEEGRKPISTAGAQPAPAKPWPLLRSWHWPGVPHGLETLVGGRSGSQGRATGPTEHVRKHPATGTLGLAGSSTPPGSFFLHFPGGWAETLGTLQERTPSSLHASPGTCSEVHVHLWGLPGAPGGDSILSVPNPHEGGLHLSPQRSPS